MCWNIILNQIPKVVARRCSEILYMLAKNLVSLIKVSFQLGKSTGNEMKKICAKNEGYIHTYIQIPTVCTTGRRLLLTYVDLSLIHI